MRTIFSNKVCVVFSFSSVIFPEITTFATELEAKAYKHSGVRINCYTQSCLNVTTPEPDSLGISMHFLSEIVRRGMEVPGWSSSLLGWAKNICVTSFCNNNMSVSLCLYDILI